MTAEPASPPHVRYRIGDWLFVPAAVCLRGAVGERRLTPQQLRLLWAFIEAPEHSLGKQQIVEQVWDGRVVTDDAIARAISELRKQLDTGADSAEYINTQHGHGYRLALAPQQVAAAVTISRGRIAGVAALLLLGLLVWYTLAPPSSRDERLALVVQIEPLQQTLDPERQYLAIAPAGTQIWLQQRGGMAQLRRTENGREFRLWQARGRISAARGSPLGSRLALVQLDQDCSVIGVDLASTDLHRWASCNSDTPLAIGWRDEQTLLTARRTLDGMLELTALRWPGAPSVRQIPAAGCLQPLQIAQRGDRAPLLSCRSERGAALYRVEDEALSEVLVYRSIRLWVEDQQGRIYLASEPAWQPGITRFDPRSGESAYARTGYIADLAIDGDQLIAIRDRRNLDLLSLDLRTLSESAIEGGAQMTVAFTVDADSGQLWQLDDRRGELAIYADDQVVQTAALSDVDLAQVVAMRVDADAGWLVLTTLNADRHRHHWLTLDPVTKLAQFEARDAQLVIADGNAEYVNPQGEWNAFALNSGSPTTPSNTVVPAESTHCPGSPLRSTERTIEIISEAEGALFRDLDPIAGELRRRWRDSRLNTRCGLIQPRLDEPNKRLVYGHLRDANKELLRIRVPAND